MQERWRRVDSRRIGIHKSLRIFNLARGLDYWYPVGGEGSIWLEISEGLEFAVQTE